jgi:uncharacterized membrane protein
MIAAVLQSLQDSVIGTAIGGGATLFPWIECVHVLALTAVIGSIALVDLRLIGVVSRGRSVAQVTDEALPLTWSGFAVAVITGSLMFVSNAVAYGHNTFFLIKLALLALAGLNMAVYQGFLSRGAEHWVTAASTPLRARVAGAVSLTLWVGIAAAGRWIGFTMGAVA